MGLPHRRVTAERLRKKWISLNAVRQAPPKQAMGSAWPYYDPSNEKKQNLF